jgi:hypothetical protein
LWTIEPQVVERSQLCYPRERWLVHVLPSIEPPVVQRSQLCYPRERSQLCYPREHWLVRAAWLLVNCLKASLQASKPVRADSGSQEDACYHRRRLIHLIPW